MTDASGPSPDLPDALWSCRPALASSIVYRTVDGQVVLWPAEATLGSVDPVASVVIPWLDGTATVEELAEDFAIAADVDDADAARFVGELVCTLATVGALDGTDDVLDELRARGESTDDAADEWTGDAADVPEIDLGPRAARPATADPAIGEGDPAGDGDTATSPYLAMSRDELAAAATRVEVTDSEDGHTVTTTHLADGTMVVSTEITFEIGDPGDSARFATLVGNQSPAELAPGDSCLGSKLRTGEDVDVVNIDLGDTVASVRCDDERVLDALAALPAARRADPADDGDRGPVEVFVVSPYEGDGPMRVFDGMGRRKGRPRTADDAIAVVADVLDDDVLGRRDRVHLASDAVVRDGAAVLLPLGTVLHPRLARSLARCGITTRWTRPVLAADGTIELIDPLRGDGAPEHYAVRAVLTAGDQRSDSPQVRLLEQLLGHVRLPEADRRRAVLDAAIALTATVPATPVVDDVDGLIATVAALLGAPVPLAI